MLKSEILLYVGHSFLTILLHLCLDFPVQEAYLPRPECGAVDLDGQLLSPVTTDHGFVKLYIEIIN